MPILIIGFIDRTDKSETIWSDALIMREKRKSMHRENIDLMSFFFYRTGAFHWVAAQHRLLVLSGCFFISLITAWTSQGVSLIMKSPYHSSATLKLLRLLCNRTIPIEFHMWVNGVWHWLFVSDTIFRPVQTITVSQRHMLYDHVSNSRTTYKLPIHIVSQKT